MPQAKTSVDPRRTRGNPTSTSYILDNSSLTFRKRQDRDMTLGSPHDVTSWNQHKPLSTNM